MKSSIDKLFWVELPDKPARNLDPVHLECLPHRFAVETGKSWVRTEFFALTSNAVICTCGGYCNENQRTYIINYMDNMLKMLNIQRHRMFPPCICLLFAEQIVTDLVFNLVTLSLISQEPNTYDHFSLIH